MSYYWISMQEKVGNEWIDRTKPNHNRYYDYDKVLQLVKNLREAWGPNWDLQIEEKI